MSRFLFTLWPYIGSLHSMVGVAHQLAARGHEVGFYTGKRAAPLLMQEGFLRFPMSCEMDEQIERLFLTVDGVGQRWWQELWDAASISRVVRMLREFFVDPIPEQVTDIDRILKDWKPDVLICEPAMWAPRIVVHEARKVPVAMYELPALTLPDPMSALLDLHCVRRAVSSHGCIRIPAMLRSLSWCEISGVPLMKYGGSTGWTLSTGPSQQPRRNCR